MPKREKKEKKPVDMAKQIENLNMIFGGIDKRGDKIGQEGVSQTMVGEQ